MGSVLVTVPAPLKGRSGRGFGVWCRPCVGVPPSPFVSSFVTLSLLFGNSQA